MSNYNRLPHVRVSLVAAAGFAGFSLANAAESAWPDWSGTMAPMLAGAMLMLFALILLGAFVVALVEDSEDDR